MKKIIIIGIVAALTMGAATAAERAAEGMSKEAIAKLPQNKVEEIKRACARLYEDRPDSPRYSLRIVCEDGEYRALQFLIERGSEPPPK